LDDVGTGFAGVDSGMRSEIGMSCDGEVLCLDSVFGGGLREEVERPNWLADVDDVSSTIGEVCR